MQKQGKNIKVDWAADNKGRRDGLYPVNDDIVEW